MQRLRTIYGNWMTKRARRNKGGRPHYGVKESAKVYEEVRNPWTDHTTIRRVA
jgi:hypothetical protein